MTQDQINALNALTAAIGNFRSMIDAQIANKLEATDLATIEQDVSDIKALIASDDAALDQLQEIVDFIKLNKDTLDALAVENIAGLQDVLDGKVSNTDLAAEIQSLADAGTISMGGEYLEILAGGSIENGSPVVLNSLGEVEKAFGQNMGLGDFADVDASNGAHTCICETKEDGKFVVFWVQDNTLKAVPAFFDQGVVSYGLTVDVASATDTGLNCAYDYSSDKIVVLYRTPDAYLNASSLDFNGNELSIFQVDKTITTNFKTVRPAIAFDDVNEKFIVAYSTGAHFYTCILQINTDGNFFETSHTVVVYGDYVTNFDLCYIKEQDRFVLSYADGSFGGYGTNYVLQILGGVSISLRHHTRFKSNLVGSTVRNTAGEGGYFYVSFYDYQTSTRKIKKGGVNGDNSWILSEVDVTSSSSYYGSFSYMDGKVYFCNLTENFQIDDNNDVLSLSYQGSKFEGEPDRRSINIVKSFGKLYSAYILYGQSKIRFGELNNAYSNVTKDNFIGFSDGSFAYGENAKVKLVGSVSDAQENLVIGKKYYIQYSGNLSTDISDVFAGTSVSNSKIIIKG